MIRIFVTDSLKKSLLLPLNERTQHYLFHVMRCNENDQILCFNGRDGEWLCILKHPSKKQSFLEVQKQLREQDAPAFCALCPALIKKDNMDLVLQKATELGVTDIYPLVTDHTAHAHFNKSHAQLVVQEAAEQCERLTLPTIHDPLSLNNTLQKLPKNCGRYALVERQNETQKFDQYDSVAFFVGPEGGWSDKEKAFFKKNNFNTLSFDVGILRAETACIAILSCWHLGRTLY